MVLLILSNVSCTYKQWERDTLCLHFIKRKLVCLNIKGSDRLFKVVELNMQCCGQILSDSFETSSWRSVNPEFERKFDVQNFYLGDGYVFRISSIQFKKLGMYIGPLLDQGFSAWHSLDLTSGN